MVSTAAFGYVQRVGFYAFLIHSSTLSEVVFCTTSAYLSPCTRVYVRGLSPSGRIFQIPTVWSNMITQIPKWYLLITFGYELVAIPRGNASIVCGASYHVRDLPSSVMMWRKIRVTVCHRLHQRRAILANRDIQRDIFPPIYHGLWHSPTRMKLSAVKLREKKPCR